MKKKLLFAAVVIGALSLGSCVDDNESASVEAVRNAKAEQLKSIAAMNNAQAEATRLLAAAESALKAAQAEAEKTQTELEKVLIDIKKVELEKAQLELKLQQDKYSQELQVALKQLENQLSNLENEKARLELQKTAIAKQLEIQEAQLASQLLYAQTEVLNAQQQLLNKQNLMEAAEKAKLQQLVTTYSTAIATLNNSKQYLFSLQSDLTRAENDLANYKELRTDLLEANQKQIATDEAQIASYKKYSNYLSNYDELVAEYNAKSLSYNEANDKLNALWNTYNQLSSNTSDPSMNAVNQSAFILAYNDFRYRVGLSDPYSDVGTTIEKTVGNRTLRFYMEKYEPITLNTERLSTYIPKYEQNIKSAKSWLESATTAYNNYAKAAEDAKKAWDDAKAATPPDDAEITRLAESYRIALENVENYKPNLTWTQAYVAQQEKNLSDLKVLMSTEAYTQFTTLLSEYNQAIVETYKPVADAYFAYGTHLYQEYIPIQEAYNSLRNILYYNNNGGLMTAVYIDNSIKYLEDRIKALKENQSYISNITSAEQLIEILKSRIEAAKAEVSVNQKYADDAKVALDAAMAE